MIFELFYCLFEFAELFSFSDSSSFLDLSESLLKDIWPSFFGFLIKSAIDLRVWSAIL